MAPTFLQGVAELSKLILVTWIVHEKEDLRPPKFHMLLSKTEKIFANLVVD